MTDPMTRPGERELVLEHTCRVELHGGPKSGWVYDFPMHWEVRDGLLVWEPPEAITAPPAGEYRLAEHDSSGVYFYDWSPA
jgi:hypothetical protein